MADEKSVPGARQVAEYIKQCKTPEEIRLRFNIPNDFTPEEEEEVRKENAWYFLQKFINYENYFIENNNNNRLLILLYGSIYDLTEFVYEHPGGEQILIHQKGKDATKDFENAYHSKFALQLAENFIVFSRQDVFI